MRSIISIIVSAAVAPLLLISLTSCASRPTPEEPQAAVQPAAAASAPAKKSAFRTLLDDSLCSLNMASLVFLSTSYAGGQGSALSNSFFACAR